MKTNNEICHDFANSWRTSEKGGNIFFETESNGDRILYSYGHHFAIARISGGVCFFTTSTYSNTTAKHISNARGAVSHYDLVFCPDPASSYQSFRSWESELKAQEKRLARTTEKNREKRAAELAATLRQIEIYCTATGEEKPLYFAEFSKVAETRTARPEAVAEAMRDRESERRAREAREQWARERAQEREARERARRLTSAERVQKWEQGENVFLSWEDTNENVPLRIEARKGYKVVKTGKGVTVTIEAARRFWAMLQAGEIQTGQRIDTGAAFYTAREVTPETVAVGCHTWRRSYLAEFSKVLETI